MQDRINDLLIERATHGLPPEQAAELKALLAQNPGAGTDQFELAAAALDLAMTDASVEAMPEHVKRRILAQVTGATGSVQTPVARIGIPRSRSFAGWAVAAALLVIAVAGWWSKLKPSSPIVQQRQALLAEAGTAQAEWGEWSDPQVSAEFKGVKGDIVWNESQQRGFMRFSGLPVNDPRKEQYQLWIVDERGMDQRISGGIFNAAAGELVVPITPSIRTRRAAAFALTIEEPGGTWVSTMKRRVVIAAIKKA